MEMNVKRVATSKCFSQHAQGYLPIGMSFGMQGNTVPGLSMLERHNVRILITETFVDYGSPQRSNKGLS